LLIIDHRGLFYHKLQGRIKLIVDLRRNYFS